MDKKLVAAITQQISRQFPEVAGQQPKVQEQTGGQSLLIYTGSGKAPNGKVIPRTVRVVADASGKILKVSTSR